MAEQELHCANRKISTPEVFIDGLRYAPIIGLHYRTQDAEGMAAKTARHVHRCYRNQD